MATLATGIGIAGAGIIALAILGGRLAAEIAPIIVALGGAS